MRKVISIDENGNNAVLQNIVPYDEVEGKAKWNADREKRQAERMKNASPETLARVAEIKARI